MANIDSNSTTTAPDSTADAEVRDYFDFTIQVMAEVFDAKALAAGAMSLLDVHEELVKPPSDELCGAITLLHILNEKLEAIKSMVDGSSFYYGLKTEV